MRLIRSCFKKWRDGLDARRTERRSRDSTRSTARLRAPRNAADDSSQHFFSQLLRPGDWLTLAGGLALVIWLFATLWHTAPASKVRIRNGDQVYGTYSLDQERSIDVPGPLGTTRVIIHQHQARIAASPCRNQYCVHQGWITHAGDASVCLPNRVTLELTGDKGYDSLNY